MKIRVYIRGATPEGTELIQKMMKAAQIEKWDVVDLNSIELSLAPWHIGIAFGKVTGRLATKHTPYLHILPDLSKLAATKANAETRANTWMKLQDIKLEAEKPAPPDTKEWMWAILKRNDQRICVYEGPKPEVNADAFISRDDVSMLLKLTEIFKADIVLLHKED